MNTPASAAMSGACSRARAARSSQAALYESFIAAPFSSAEPYPPTRRGQARPPSPVGDRGDAAALVLVEQPAAGPTRDRFVPDERLVDIGAPGVETDPGAVGV